MSAKKNFVLRLNEDSYKLIEKWATDEFRSVNGQLEWLIDKALKDAGRVKKAKPNAMDDTPEDSKSDKENT